MADIEDGKDNVERVRLNPDDVKRVRLDRPSQNGNGTGTVNGKLAEDIKIKDIVKGPGRPPGRLNNLTVMIKQAILGALDSVGEDGKGKGGAMGYMRRLAIYEPAVFASLIKRTMPLQVKADLDPNSLMAKLLQTASATRSVRNGGPPVIDLVPLPPPPKVPPAT